MKKNWKWIGLAVLSCGILVGCSEEATTKESTQQVESTFNESDVDDSMPPGVKDGRVSQEAYLETVRLIEELPILAKENQGYNKQINESNFVVSTLSFKDEYGSFLNKYDVFIKGFNLNPSSIADFELNEHIIEIVLNTEMYIEHMRLYVKHESVDFKIEANDYLNKRQVSLEALVNSMDKYELFIE